MKRLILVPLLALALDNCSDQGPQPQVPAALSVVPDSVTLTVGGDTVRLSATVVDSNGASISEPDLSWESSDPTVLSVDTSGLAAAVGNGSATVTVHSGVLSATVAVTVQFMAWSFSTSAGVSSSPAIGADGTVYVGSIDKQVYALNPHGTLKWSFATLGEVGLSPAIGADGTVYVTPWGNRVYALNPDGTLKWRSDVGAVVYGSPSIGADGTVYVGSWDHNVYALYPDGTLKWNFATRSTVLRPAIGAEGTVYVGSNDGDLYALNPDGTLQWSYPIDFFFSSSPAIGADGTVYVGSYYYLYAFNPDGTLQWRYTTFGRAESSPAIGADGTVYLCCVSHTAFAINADGTERWRRAMASGFSSPAIGADGTVYVGSGNSLYALNPDGTLKWHFATGGEVRSSPAIGTDGMVYVGSGDGNLYALRSTSLGLGVTPWPKFGHDNRNTGNVTPAVP